MSSQVRILFPPQGGLRFEVPMFKTCSETLDLKHETLNYECGSSSVGRAIAFQAIGREFEPRFPLGSLPID